MADDAKPKKEKEKSTSPFRDNIEVVVFAIAMSLKSDVGSYSRWP